MARKPAPRLSSARCNRRANTRPRGESCPPCAHLVSPGVPRVAQLSVPLSKSFSDIVARGVERAAERMIGEVDAVAIRGKHAREKRRHVRANGVLRQWAFAEGRQTVRQRGCHRLP